VSFSVENISGMEILVELADAELMHTNSAAEAMITTIIRKAE